MGRVDYHNLGVSGSYNNTEAGKHFRAYQLYFGTNHAWNYGDNKIWTSYFNQVTLNLNSLWNVYFGGEYDPSAIDDRLTRGGPLGRQPTQWGGWTQIDTDQRGVFSYSLNAFYYGDTKHGYSKDAGITITMSQTHHNRPRHPSGARIGEQNRTVQHALHNAANRIKSAHL